MNTYELCLSDSINILQIDSSVKELGVKVVYSFTWGAEVSSINPVVLDNIIEKVCRCVRSEKSIDTLIDDRVIRAYRDFYWRIGIDPTKTRPAGEAIVRRILKNGFPRINPVVDAGNLASAETLVSIGLYDVSKISFPCRITMSRGGELFKPIGGELKRLKPGLPILVDSSERVIHIYPHRDSVETSITSETNSVWIVAALVPGVPLETGIRAVLKVVEYTNLLKWDSCREIYIAD